MQKFKGIISEKILEAIKASFPDAAISSQELTLMLEYPPDSNMGDVALPCFKLSKTLRRAPVQIAQTIADALADGSIKKAEAVNGYLNLYISDEYLSRIVLDEVIAGADKYGSS